MNGNGWSGAEKGVRSLQGQGLRGPEGSLGQEQGQGQGQGQGQACLQPCRLVETELRLRINAR